MSLDRLAVTLFDVIEAITVGRRVNLLRAAFRMALALSSRFHVCVHSSDRVVELSWGAHG